VPVVLLSVLVLGALLASGFTDLGPPTVMSRTPLDKIDPLAVCNDGVSPPTPLAVLARFAPNLLQLTPNLPQFKDPICSPAGSVADYYFAAASEPASARLWVVWLQGGAWCNDKKSCADQG
jgi:hypothetical protein